MPRFSTDEVESFENEEPTNESNSSLNYFQRQQANPVENIVEENSSFMF